MVDLPSGLARRYLVLVNAGGAGSKPFGGDVGVHGSDVGLDDGRTNNNDRILRRG